MLIAKPMSAESSRLSKLSSSSPTTGVPCQGTFRGLSDPKVTSRSMPPDQMRPTKRACRTRVGACGNSRLQSNAARHAHQIRLS
jgi:hypothetical protein